MGALISVYQFAMPASVYQWFASGNDLGEHFDRLADKASTPAIHHVLQGLEGDF